MDQTGRHPFLVQDRVKCHASAATQKFFAEHADQLAVFQLPSDSPDYNPIEKLWKKIKRKKAHLHT
jgi:transposase